MDGKVVQGMIGWTDPSLLRCGRFYPRSSAPSSALLAVFSKRFACVEVDTSNYAIPLSSTVQIWARSTPQGFLFHFKAYQLFTARACPPNTLPTELRERLPPQLAAERSVRLGELPQAVVRGAWAAMNKSLLVAHEAGRLGLVVFQFPLHFGPTQANREYVMSCRASLDARFSMAVEFRDRDWYTHDWPSPAGASPGASPIDGGGPAPSIASAAAAAQVRLASAFRWLSDANMVLVGVNELHHELLSLSCPPDVPVTMPMRFLATSPAGVYIRVHRRVGSERVLSAGEIADLARNIRAIDSRGPIFVLWGTAFEDQPVINARHLADSLGPDAVYPWAAHVQRESKSKLFRGKVPSAVPKDTATAEEIKSSAEAASGDHEYSTSSSQALSLESGSGADSDVLEVSPLPSVARSLPAWCCDACTFDNAASALQCTMCESPRSAPGAAKATGAAAAATTAASPGPLGLPLADSSPARKKAKASEAPPSPAKPPGRPITSFFKPKQ
jgi:uncharacterized protein YecE (DUF72 family)